MSKFKEYHNANHHDGDDTFDDQKYKMTNGDDFDCSFVQDCYDHFEAGQQSRQAEIDELQGWIDELKITQNNLELKAEDAECVSMSLDDQGVEKCDDDGKSYSLWGRVCQFKKSNNITERDELQGRIDKALYHLDFNHDNDKDIAISILKGNKDEN